MRFRTKTLQLLNDFACNTKRHFRAPEMVLFVTAVDHASGWPSYNIAHQGALPNQDAAKGRCK